MFLYYCILLKGPSIKDVRKGGGEGVGPKADKIGHGEEGSQLCGRPQPNLI